LKYKIERNRLEFIILTGATVGADVTRRDETSFILLKTAAKDILVKKGSEEKCSDGSWLMGPIHFTGLDWSLF
jgi:hypothetical protein